MRVPECDLSALISEGGNLIQGMDDASWAVRVPLWMFPRVLEWHSLFPASAVSVLLTIICIIRRDHSVSLISDSVDHMQDPARGSSADDRIATLGWCTSCLPTDEARIKYDILGFHGGGTMRGDVVNIGLVPNEVIIQCGSLSDHWVAHQYCSRRGP